MLFRATAPHAAAGKIDFDIFKTANLISDKAIIANKRQRCL